MTTEGRDVPPLILHWVSKIVVDKVSQKIIGNQSVGPGDVSKQIASAAMAIHGKLAIYDSVDLLPIST